MTSATTSTLERASLDPRVTLALPAGRGTEWDLADVALEGRLAATRYAPTEPMQVVSPACALRRAPHAGAEQVDQLLFGERFEALTARDGFVFGQARRDGYVGWAAQDALSPARSPPTHWVRALRTFVFGDASIKTPPLACLSQNALVAIERTQGRFVRLEGGGWIFAGHVAALGEVEADPAAVARRYLGTPYLWGGRDSIGLDCSGLVQQALYACGLYAPRDSDMQGEIGVALDGPDDLERNDLVFWRGHVGLMLDSKTLLHANAHHMAVAIEPLAEALARIQAIGQGDPTAFRRLRVAPQALAEVAS